MNIEEFNRSVELLLAETISSAPDISDRIGLSAISLVRNRIQEKGENAQGSKFGNYSVGPIPEYSYKAKREKRGLQTSFVDMTFTGDTLSDVTVVENGGIGFKGYAIVKSKNSITISNGSTSGEVLGYLEDKYGPDILATNDKEDEILAEALDDELQQLVDKYFS
jgi:hypothetical protein